MSLGRSFGADLRSLVYRKALKLFFNNVFCNVQLHGQVGIHSFKPGVFFFQLFDPLKFRCFHTSITLTPLIQIGFTYSVFTVDLFGTFAVIKFFRMPAICAGLNVLFFIFYSFKIKHFVYF